jgi:hypothetical protein
MAKSIKSKKIVVSHPATGTEMKFDEEVYIPVKTGIL